jgi:hypothetical protein
MSNNSQFGSTGPRTENGKAVSSQNARKHDLCSRTLRLSPEEWAEYNDMRERYARDLQPADDIEQPSSTKSASTIGVFSRPATPNSASSLSTPPNSTSSPSTSATAPATSVPFTKPSTRSKSASATAANKPYRRRRFVPQIPRYLPVCRKALPMVSNSSFRTIQTHCLNSSLKS